jgi:multiple antibiotic resistance protein
MDELRQLITIFIPLLIIMDPLGNLPFFLLFTKQNTVKERKRMAAASAVSASIILIIFGITGDFILRFFGIGLPAFQLAGGFIFFIYALQMLHLIPSGMKTTTEEEQEGVDKASAALVPMATPMLAGPGAITAVLVWQQSNDGSSGIFLLLSAIIAACLTVYIVFRFADRISGIMGIGGIRVVTRLMGLLLAVIAVQFMVNGFQQIG